MSDTDATAEAILKGYYTPFYDEPDSVPITDLRRMATLWLEKANILTAMKDFKASVDGQGGTAFADFAVDRFDQAIEALEKE